MDINKFKNVCIVGLGRSGISLVELLLSLNKRVKVTESKDSKNFSSLIVNRFRDWGVEFEFGGHSKDFVKDSDLCVVSPGVDLLRSKIYGIVKELQILTVGEIELASWLTQAKIVAITGTNGKTTTTFLTYRLIRSTKNKVYLAGNIGIPFSSCVLGTKSSDIIVLEVSSFQLETTIEFKPFVACLLNLEPDHLDRYRDFSQYVEAKKNIFKNQKEEDWAVLNRNLPFRDGIEKSIKAKLVYFSNEFSNENYSAVYRIGEIFGLDKECCKKFFSRFKGLPHRLQIVRRIRGVTFINDSKGTNPNSTIWAIKNIDTPIILIAGGKDKGLDYSLVKPYLCKVKKVNLIGETALKISDILKDTVKVEIFVSLKEAVVNAFSEANSNDTVLFSPMCSSFDMFANYRDRGRRFIEIVKNL
ncbi:MAG: Mur ligase family protein [Candidatus Omnitrophica bacterium]|nr:Mur ligase family protein [Candidatus Omnitrophota bacterium]